MALAQLAKEVLKDDWSATGAALRMRVLVGENVGVLHHIRGRLCRVASVRRDPGTNRALATLDLAVGRGTIVRPSLDRAPLGLCPWWTAESCG